MIEFLNAVKWVCACFAVSIMLRPYLRMKNLKFIDEGFSLSFTLGLTFTFFTSFIISAITKIPFSSSLAWSVTIIMAGLSFVIPNFRNEIIENINNPKAKLKSFLAGFLIFAALFFIALWIRGYKAEISFDTEKYMDYGFVQSIYRQMVAIPEDIWFAGRHLNYYFMGQSCTAYLCRLSFVTPEYGYSFMLCTLFATVIMTVFTSVEAFIRSFLKEKKCSLAGALVSSSMVCCGGNGHYLIYGIVMPLLEKLTGKSFSYNHGSYFFPDSTVYIGTNPETMDKGKTEFFSYTLVLGDLHAHAVNVMFVVLLITILFDYALDKQNEDKKEDYYRLFVIGVLLGLFRGTNYWDFPIYFIVTGAVVLFCDFVREGIGFKTLFKVLIKGVFILLIGTILILPFSIGFDKMASKICFAQNHSPLIKMLILWGIPVIISIFLIANILRLIIKDKRRAMGHELLIIAFALCAIGLVIVPEIIYVKDIYGTEYARFNTMFKLTYQACILFGIIIGIAVAIWMNCKKHAAYIMAITVSLLMSSYIFTAIHQYMGNVFDPDLREGCSAIDFVLEDSDSQSEASAIGIINADDRKRVRIIEATGDSYSECCRLSVFSGACTLVGWNVHEWMWRNDWDIVSDRIGEVFKFYTCNDKAYCKAIIDKYDIDYIFVGPKETERYVVLPGGFKDFCEEIPVSEDREHVLYKVKK